MSKSETLVQFGKYKGKTVQWVFDNDRDYADWLSTKSNSKTKTKRSMQSVIDKNK